MKRHMLNALIDLLMLNAMFGLIGTGFIVRYTLPPGTGGRGHGPSDTLLGMTRHGWGDVHFWLAVGVVSLLVLHVALHWSWVCATLAKAVLRNDQAVRPRFGGCRHWYGVGVLGIPAAMVAALLCFAAGHVERSFPGGVPADGPIHKDKASHPQHGHIASAASSRGAGIRGSMTIQQVVWATGVPLTELRETLNLPRGIGPDERIGRVAHRLGLNLHNVRKVLGDRQDH